jgi:hypothetical protein
MTDDLSTWRDRELQPNHGPYSQDHNTPVANGKSGQPDDDDDEDDTPLELIVPITSAPDYDPEPDPIAPAIGPPCKLAVFTPRISPFSLCAVVIEADPDCPDDPENIVEGQIIRKFLGPKPAKAAMSGMASHRNLLPPLGIQPTHLVVNDASGREVYRQAVRKAA